MRRRAEVLFKDSRSLRTRRDSVGHGGNQTATAFVTTSEYSGARSIRRVLQKAARTRFGTAENRMPSERFELLFVSFVMGSLRAGAPRSLVRGAIRMIRVIRDGARSPTRDLQRTSGVREQLLPHPTTVTRVESYGAGLMSVAVRSITTRPCFVSPKSLSTVPGGSPGKGRLARSGP